VNLNNVAIYITDNQQAQDIEKLKKIDSNLPKN